MPSTDRAVGQQLHLFRRGNAAALTVTTATLTYVATPASQSYGTANTSFAGTVTGFVAGDTQATATTGALSFTSATRIQPGGQLCHHGTDPEVYS